ncbi:MAG: hypothetical protein Fur0044_12470 [Anaerolineae bacterium]
MKPVYFTQAPASPQIIAGTDPWRVLRIQGEFVHGFDTLAELGPAVSIFGSARTEPDDPLYQAAVETARLLAGGKISPADLDLLVITDSPPEVRDLILQAMGDSGQREEKEDAAREETQKVYES